MSRKDGGIASDLDERFLNSAPDQHSTEVLAGQAKKMRKDHAELIGST
ncbi:MAG: hypothetical protein ACJA09_000371 [Alcanivorax sp.]|jgi:hypothetical protein